MIAVNNQGLAAAENSRAGWLISSASARSPAGDPQATGEDAARQHGGPEDDDQFQTEQVMHWSLLRGERLAVSYCWLAVVYASSGTGSSQVVGSPPSGSFSRMEKWLMKVSAAAPCQCSSSGGQMTVSPARMLTTEPSRVPTRPTPSVTCRV